MPPSRSPSGVRPVPTFLVFVAALAALAGLRAVCEPRFESVRRVESALGEDVAFESAPDGSREIRLAMAPASDGPGRAAVALAIAPRIVMRSDGRYAFRVAPAPGIANELLAPGAGVAEQALGVLHERIDRQAAETASRLASHGDGEIVFLDSRSRRIPLAMTAIPDLRRLDGPGQLLEALRRTLERLGAETAAPAPASAPAASGPGSAESRADAIARAARERASAWRQDGAAAEADRAELAAFADRVAAFASEIAPGGPETRRILAVAARDAVARFVQHAGPLSVSPPVRVAALLLLGAIGGALVAAVRSGIAAGIGRPVVGGAFFSWFAVTVLESNGILPTLSTEPLGSFLPRAAEVVAIAFGFIGGFVLDGRIVSPRARATSTGR
jgi:hypothetical protein